MEYQLVPLLLAVPFAGLLFGLLFWVVLVRPRARRRAFLALAGPLGATATPFRENRHAYLDSRGYGTYVLARLRALWGTRLVVEDPENDQPVVLDLLMTLTQRDMDYEGSTQVVCFLAQAGGTALRIQPLASSFSSLQASGLRVCAQRYAPNLTFDLKTPLEPAHQVASEAPDADREFLTQDRCRAIASPLKRLQAAVGNETTICCVRSLEGVALVVREPLEGFWRPEVFVPFVADFRALATALSMKGDPTP